MWDGAWTDLSSTGDTNKTYRINNAPESKPAAHGVTFLLLPCKTFKYTTYELTSISNNLAELSLQHQWKWLLVKCSARHRCARLVRSCRLLSFLKGQSAALCARRSSPASHFVPNDTANIHRVAPMLSFYLHNPHHFQWHLEMWQLLPVFLMVNRGNLVSWFSFYLTAASILTLLALPALFPQKKQNQESNPGGNPSFCGSAGSFAEKITSISRARLI